MANPWSASNEVPILRRQGNQLLVASDRLAIEEPLEIRLGFGPGGERQQRSLAVTMRTPGDDFDLVRGFLFSERIISRKSELLQLRYLGAGPEPEAQPHIVLAELHPGLVVDFDRFERNFYAASSCGICGKASMEFVQQPGIYPLPQNGTLWDAASLSKLSEALWENQALFQETGGVHAAAIYNPNGELALVREDVGRHNALDKLIGAAFKQEMLPLADALLLVSGRAGFELVQKALSAGISFMASVGAPSSLAVELASAYRMTLVGFLRPDSFNVYSGQERISC